MRIAIVDGLVVRNVAAWDGVMPWDPGYETHELLPDEQCGPGWHYHPGQPIRFTAPEET